MSFDTFSDHYVENHYVNSSMDNQYFDLFMDDHYADQLLGDQYFSPIMNGHYIDQFLEDRNIDPLMDDRYVRRTVCLYTQTCRVSFILVFFKSYGWSYRFAM